MPNTLIHLASNLILAGIIYLIYKYILKKEFHAKYATIQLLASNIIDIDHLLADPIYDPARCSINVHPLHSWFLFPLYFIGLFFKKYRFFFIGVGMHLILDYVDCFL